MKEYIDRGKFLKECMKTFGNMGITIKAIEGIADECTADVVEVRHEEWKLGKGGTTYSCTYCDYKAFPREQEEWFFCPRCGAKMDGERKENK